MNILRFGAYFFPEKTSANHLINDLFKVFSEKNINCIFYVPEPTRGVSEKLRKLYKTKKKEKLYNGYVEVNRFSMFREKRNPILRAIRYLLCFFIQYLKGINTKDIQIIFSGSTPPINGMLSILVAKKLTKKYGYKVPFVYQLDDIFPDSLVNANLTKKNSIIWKLGRVIENYTYKNSDKIIVISNSMKNNILAKGVSESKVEVIPNWIDTNNVFPIKKEENFLLKKLGLCKSDFIVVYAGNFGEAQGTDIIFKVAKLMEDKINLKFVLFGGGLYFDLAKEKAKTMQNVIINDLLPLEYVSQVYSLGDIALITCKKGTGLAGMPSKTWSIMACNTPIVASFDLDSELAYILKISGAGVCVEPENIEKLKNIIETRYKEFLSGTNGTKSRTTARDYVKRYCSKEICINKYIEILKYFC